jgi:hypothetical protein
MTRQIIVVERNIVSTGIPYSSKKIEDVELPNFKCRLLFLILKNEDFKRNPFEDQFI